MLTTPPILYLILGAATQGSFKICKDSSGLPWVGDLLDRSLLGSAYLSHSIHCEKRSLQVICKAHMKGRCKPIFAGIVRIQIQIFQVLPQLRRGVMASLGHNKASGQGPGDLGLCLNPQWVQLRP